MVYVDHRAHGSPVEQPLGDLRWYVDATVAHRLSESGVPVGAVDAIAAVEIHHVGHVGQVIIDAAHIVIAQLVLDMVLAGGGWRAGQSCRDRCETHQFLTFIRGELLVR